VIFVKNEITAPSPTYLINMNNILKSLGTTLALMTCLSTLVSCDTPEGRGAVIGAAAGAIAGGLYDGHRKGWHGGPNSRTLQRAAVGGAIGAGVGALIGKAAGNAERDRRYSDGYYNERDGRYYRERDDYRYQGPSRRYYDDGYYAPPPRRPGYYRGY
jgi:hypothetical protein